MNSFDDSETVREVWEELDRGRHIAVVEIARAAVKDGARIEWISDRYAWAHLKDRRIPIFKFVGPESAAVVHIVTDKSLTKHFLDLAGVKTPKGYVVKSPQEAILAQERINRPVVVKPRSGRMGRGVTVRIEEANDVRQAFRRAHQLSDEVIVEECIDGDEYRVHATSTECHAVFRRLLPSVVGDGESSVGELVDDKNKARKKSPASRNFPIPRDDVGTEFLERQGLNWDLVLAEGKSITVRNVNGITSGGESEQCFDSVDLQIKEVAVKAMGSIPGGRWGGVDVIQDYQTGRAYVIELNSDAAFYGSSFPTVGARRDVGDILWKQHLEHSTADLTDHPPKLFQLSDPKQVIQDGSGQMITLEDLFQAYLARHGMVIDRLDQRLWSATSKVGEKYWFEAGLGTRDTYVSIHPLKRPVLLRNRLRKAGISVLRASTVQTVAGLRRFQSRSKRSVQLLPTQTEAGESFTHVVVNPEVPTTDRVLASIFDNRQKWLAQELLPGKRLRVISTGERSLLVVGERGIERPSASELDQVVDLAVQATRVLPQLSWAEVKIVVTECGCFVESMSCRPCFRDDDQIEAGSLEEVYQMLLSRSEPVPSSSDPSPK